jgi:hypothetical protein
MTPPSPGDESPGSMKGSRLKPAAAGGAAPFKGLPFIQPGDSSPGGAAVRHRPVFPSAGTFTRSVAAILKGSARLAALVATILALTAPAHALTACTAADISAQESNCPTTGACTIANVFNVGDVCTLDFSTRAVTLTGKLIIGSGSVAIKVGSLTIAPGGFIDGRGGQSSAPGNDGGSVTIVATGAVTVQKSGSTDGRIDVSGNASAGTVEITAGGAVTISGRIEASDLSSTAVGGLVRITAGGDLVAESTSTVTAKGGSSATPYGGGAVELIAAGKIDLGTSLDVSGSDGGFATLAAGADILVRGVNANATGGGPGGTVELTAGKGIRILAAINLNGNNNDIGYLTAEARFGDLSIEAGGLSAEGNDPYSFGGVVDLYARGSISVASHINGHIFAALRKSRMGACPLSVSSAAVG